MPIPVIIIIFTLATIITWEATYVIEFGWYLTSGWSSIIKDNGEISVESYGDLLTLGYLPTISCLNGSLLSIYKVGKVGVILRGSKSHKLIKHYLKESYKIKANGCIRPNSL